MFTLNTHICNNNWLEYIVALQLRLMSLEMLLIFAAMIDGLKCSAVSLREPYPVYINSLI